MLVLKLESSITLLTVTLNCYFISVTQQVSKTKANPTLYGFCYVVKAMLLIFRLMLHITGTWLTVKAVIVVITPAGRGPVAAARPASLTLQSRLAQESVVVRGSPRALPSDPSHGANNSKISQTQVLLNLVSVQINSGKVLMQFGLSHTLMRSPHFYSSTVDCVKSTPLGNHQTSTSSENVCAVPEAQTCAPPLNNPPQSFPQPDPSGMMSGILCECVS